VFTAVLHSNAVVLYTVFKDKVNHFHFHPHLFVHNKARHTLQCNM